MVSVLVIGGSAGIGFETVKAALTAGHRVRAFARHTERMRLEHEALEKMNGDALDVSSVRRSLAEMDAVILCVGVPLNLKLLTGPITLFSEATASVLEAMGDAGVDRLLAVTGFGAGDSASSISAWQRPAFNLVFGQAYLDKGIQEDLIKGSGFDWTIARPGVLTNGRCGNYQVLTNRDDWRNGLVSRASVADFLVRQLGADALSGQAPVLINR